MIEHLNDTTTRGVNDFLVRFREKSGAVTLGRVLTLIIVTPEDHMEEPIEAAAHASREHPARVIVLATNPEADEDVLDAEIRLGGDAGAAEIIILRARGRTVTGIDTLVNPLLLPDAPIVTWWPVDPPEVPSQDPLGRISQRRITDAIACENPPEALASLRLAYTSGDTDLTWTRVTTWRGLIASSLDLPPRDQVRGLVVEGNPQNPSVILIAAWLRVSLDRAVTVEDVGYHGLRSVTIHRDSGQIRIERLDDHRVVLALPGDRSPQQVTMPRRSLAECLSEELRRLDPDEVYGKVLMHSFQEPGHAAEFALSRPAPRDVVRLDIAQVAQQASDLVIARLRAAVDERGIAHLALTGGTAGMRTISALATAAEEAGFSFGRVHLWWGDERFVPGRDPDRNDLQIEDSFLDVIDVPTKNVHRVAAEDSGLSLSEAAYVYHRELVAAGCEPGTPFFDVLLLGMGPDAHVASLFPRHPAQQTTDRLVVPVTDSPKPPADRVSLTFPALNASRSVVFLVGGADKAKAVAAAHGTIEPWETPASAVRGAEETVWVLDSGAASTLMS